MDQPQQPQPQPPTPTPTWWGRHWKWVLPVGCLVPLLACGGLAALIFTMVTSVIKSSDVYAESLARARTDERVAALLGTPIRQVGMVSGSLSTSGPSGDADLSIPLSGPKGSATLYVAAKKAAGRWDYSTLEVAPQGGGDRIDLRADPGG